jgi:hypothetical protein
MTGKSLDEFMDAVTEAACEGLYPLIDEGVLLASMQGARELAGLIARRAAALLLDDPQTDDGLGRQHRPGMAS